MARRSNRPRLTPVADDGRNSAGFRRPRDPLTRLSIFCVLLSLGLVGAAIYMTYPDSLNQAGGAEVSTDQFPGMIQQAAITLVHTRTVWIAIAMLSAVTAAIAHRTRKSPRASRWVVLSPVALALVVGIHAAAQGWLQSRGSLHTEIRIPATGMQAAEGMPSTMAAAATGTAPRPVTIHIETIRRMTMPEGTGVQWQLLFGGDLLFAAPWLLAWVLSFARKAAPTIAEA